MKSPWAIPNDPRITEGGRHVIDPEFQELERQRELYIEAEGAPAEVLCPRCGQDDVYGQDDGHYLCNGCECEFDS